jgi:hypothetical protein
MPSCEGAEAFPATRPHVHGQQLGQAFPARVQKACALRPLQPLVAVARVEVAADLLDVHRELPHGLRAVHQAEDATRRGQAAVAGCHTPPIRVQSV